MLILTIIYFLFWLLVIGQLGKKTILYFPLMHISADLLINVFGRVEGQIHPGYARAALILFYLIILLKDIKLTHINRYILLFLSYLFIIILLFSNNVLFSLNTYLKVLIYYLMFPLAYSLINNFDDFKILLRSIVFSYALVFVNLIISNVFQIGESQYLSETFYEGTGGDPISFSILFFLISPVILKMRLFKGRFSIYLSYILIISSVLFVIISVRRVANISIAVGILLHTYLLRSKRQLKFILVLLSIIILTYPFYSGALLPRLERRQEVFARHGLEGEKRVLEIELTIDEILRGNLRHSLIGSELFNSYNYTTEKYGNWGFYNRTFHTFFANYLHGAGIVGFIWAVLILYLILKKILSYDKFYRGSSNWIYIKSTCIVLIIVWFIQLNSFGIWLITENSIFYLFLGSILGVLTKTKNTGGLLA